MQAERIVGIKKLGKQKTLDIQVKNSHHLFYANGIATSNSHGHGYAETGYWCAYSKHHFPLHFYTSWLNTADGKAKPQLEIEELVSDAKNLGIKINTPNIRMIKKFSGVVLDSQNIYMGLSHIKGVGDSHINKMIENVYQVENQLSKPIEKWSWNEFLFHFSDFTSKTVINGLIHCGALSIFEKARSKMAFEYNLWNQLTKAEKQYIIDKGCGNIIDGLNELFIREKTTERRKEIIKSLLKTVDDPAYSMKDNPQTIIAHEKSLLGINLTYSIADIFINSCGDTTCKEFNDGKTGDMTIVAHIDNIREILTKKGTKMSFMGISDHTGSIKSTTVFPDVWKKFRHLLYETNIVSLYGKKNYYNGQFSFVINGVKLV